MPAPVASHSPARTTNPNSSKKPSAPARTKKSRVARRRGHARDGFQSDDEIERDDRSSDSEPDSEESLSSDLATDSDQDSASEDERPLHQPDTHTPNTSQSSSALDKDTAVNGSMGGTFFAASNWSEMVAEENANGAAELPVIEFSDFKASGVLEPPLPTRKSKRSMKKKAPLASSSRLDPPPEPSPTTKQPSAGPVNGDVAEKVNEDKEEELLKRLSPQLRRPFGQSARQAYQQKLETDPSFVPKVGGFWGHDDRLMDKDLRSLSGWWRGRWQGRGRGRGPFTFESGRGGPQAVVVNNDGAERVGRSENVELPPIERPWTHDGFEEMKRKEEQRLEVQTQRQVSSPLRGSARGRGGSVANRGGRGGPRGGFINAGSRAAAAAKQGRIWYAMKPEHMWTKQSENFLFFDSSLKQRAQGITYHIHLPGSQSQTIKISPLLSQIFPTSVSDSVKDTTGSFVGSDSGETSIMVRLPKRVEMEPPTTIDETSLEDVFTVRPRLVNVEPIPLPAPSNTKSSPPAERPTHHSQPSSSTADPNPSVRSQLEQLSLEPTTSDPERWAQTEKAVLRQPTSEPPNEEPAKPAVSEETNSQRPTLPPIQTVYSPPPALPSPVYTSSYGYPPLPPGIALDPHGMPYEMATGRPVFLPGPPPPVYNPRPLMRSHIPQQNLSFMTPPPHMHHPSAISPDFIAHQPPSHSHTPSATVPINGFIDPATGAPIFSLPKSLRVEIRAPGEDTRKSVVNSSAAKAPPTSSPSTRAQPHLRTSSASYANSPSQHHPGADYGYHSYSSSSDVSALPSYASLPEGSTAEGAQTLRQHIPTAPSMMPYPAYQQYYYPEAAYGYPAYVDMPQIGQYDMYPPMEANGPAYY